MHIIVRLFEVNETTKLCMVVSYTIPILGGGGVGGWGGLFSLNDCICKI
jgi:hypothetical protein